MKKTEQPVVKEISQSKPQTQHIVLYVVLGILVGFVIFAAIRIIKYAPQHVHYHANFQVWINGKQETFQNPLYYQEVASCSAYEDADPKHRAHMHDEVYDVVHVHASGVTWNQFFENINVGAEPTSFRIGDTVYTNTPTESVTYILNGKKVPSLVGQPIQSEDTLLINYGSEDVSALQAKAAAIPNKAHEYNLKKDPASCSGDTAPTFQERLQHLFN